MTNWFGNIPAPVDADGREVPLDTKKLVYKGKTRGVVSIAYNLAIGVWMVIFDGVVECPRLSSCTLPDSWEQLERDVRGARRDAKWALASCRYFGYDNVESCVGCPARDEDNCENAVFDDILRRAKELAGVADGE